MTFWIVLGAVLLFLFLLLLVPVRLEVDFQEEFSLALRFLFLKIQILPGKEKEEPKPEPEQKSGKNAGGMGKKIKTILKREGFWGFVTSLLEFVRMLGRCSKRLLSHILLRQFDLYLCVAGVEDAAAAALLYGQLSAAIYSACGVLFSLAPCKKKSVTVDLDYQAEENLVRFSGKASIRPLFVLKEGLTILIKGIPFLLKLR